MELVAVPGTHDVHVRMVEGLAVIDAVLVDELLHLRHAQALAGGPALVRAKIAIGVVLAAVTDDADLDLAGAHHPHPALGDLALPTHQHFRHRFPLSSVLCCVSTLPHRECARRADARRNVELTGISSASSF